MAKTNKTPKVAKATSKGKAKGFENPYRPQGGYYASVAAIMERGLNKAHAIDDKFLALVRKHMGDSWKSFASKQGKLTAKERQIVNLQVICRKADYGLPIVKQGYTAIFDGRSTPKTIGIFKTK